MTRAERLTQVVKTYDKSLYVIRTNRGDHQVWRRELPKDVPGLSLSARDEKQFILALTDNWLLQGTPVDWGIEPLLNKLSEMDNWRDDSSYDEMVKARTRIEELRNRRFKNDARAKALDIRRDIAKAAGDYIHQK